MSSSEIPRRRWKRPSVRTMRLVALAMSIAGVGVLFIGSIWEAEAAHVSAEQRTWSVLLRRGCIEIWRDNATIPGDFVVQGQRAEREPGFHARLDRSYNTWISVPWRPYHTTTLRPPDYTATTHGLTVPLWPVAVAGLLLLGYTHGLIVGAKRAAVGRCRKCGYDIGKLAVGTPCPECGTPDYRASGNS